MNPQHSSSPVTLDIDAGLAERYSNALEVVRAGAHSHRKPLKTIAADMDLSPSDLSRKLANNPDDPRRLTLLDLESYVVSTGDVQPILYLVQKFCTDPQAKQREALVALAKLAPQIQALLKQAGVAE